jgi:hypothetical protein
MSATLTQHDPLEAVPDPGRIHAELAWLQTRERVLRRQLRLSMIAQQEREGLAGQAPDAALPGPK